MTKPSIIRRVFLISILIFVGTLLNAQNPDSLKVKLNGKYFKSFFTDSKDIVLSPIRWRTKEWVATGAAIGGTFLLYQYDSKINDYFKARQTDLGVNLSKHGLEPWGSGLYSFPTLALFYAQGAIWKNERSKKVALLGAKAYILSGLFVQFPKMLINRHRPYHDTPNQHDIFEGPSFPLYKAFPSGHTTSVFSIAAVIASEYNETVWVPIVTYTIAGLSGISRLYDNKHWASDVFFGAAFGWAIGKLVHTSRNWKVNTFPVITNESAGLYINYQF